MPNSSKSLPWFLVKTKPKQEPRAVANLQNQGVDVFLPQIDVERIQRGQRVTKREPMFPGYIFIKLPDFESMFHKVKYTFGVKGFVQFGNNFPGIPDSLVDNLKQLTSGQDSSKRIKAQNTPDVGDNVEITTGPFTGLMAKIIKLDGESRCIVLLDFLHKQVEATFTYEELRRA